MKLKTLKITDQISPARAHPATRFEELVATLNKIILMF